MRERLRWWWRAGGMGGVGIGVGVGVRPACGLAPAGSSEAFADNSTEPSGGGISTATSNLPRLMISVYIALASNSRRRNAKNSTSSMSVRRWRGALSRSFAKSTAPRLGSCSETPTRSRLNSSALQSKQSKLDSLRAFHLSPKPGFTVSLDWFNIQNECVGCPIYGDSSRMHTRSSLACKRGVASFRPSGAQSSPWTASRPATRATPSSLSITAHIFL